MKSDPVPTISAPMSSLFLNTNPVTPYMLSI